MKSVKGEKKVRGRIVGWSVEVACKTASPMRLGWPPTHQGPTPLSLTAGRCASDRGWERLPHSLDRNQKTVAVGRATCCPRFCQCFLSFMLFMLFMVKNPILSVFLPVIVFSRKKSPCGSREDCTGNEWPALRLGKKRTTACQCRGRVLCGGFGALFSAQFRRGVYFRCVRR